MLTHTLLHTLNVLTPCRKSFDVRLFDLSICRPFYLSTVISVKQQSIGAVFFASNRCDIILEYATQGLSDKPRGIVIFAYAHGE
jgi:hypothetical protein